MVLIVFSDTSTLEADLVALPLPTTVKEKVLLGERLTALDLALHEASHDTTVEMGE